MIKSQNLNEKNNLYKRGVFTGGGDFSSVDFSSISLGIASPEDILAKSSGQVKNPETINYRTFKPERDGLFCARIFGPIKDYECLCGKYKRRKYKGILCDKCEVLVTLSKVRRERMGHIELVCPIVHTWFLKSQPSRISTLLGLTLKDAEKVAYYEANIVLDPGNTTLNRFQVLTDNEYIEALDTFGDVFKVGIGGSGLRSALSSLDLKDEAEKIKFQISSTKSIMALKSLNRRLKVVNSFLNSSNKPEWMVMTRLQVLPPDLRPLVMLDGGRFASSDLNELYRRVINRNNRLKRLMDVGAPEMIIRNEKKMLQESVDTLLNNSTTKNKVAKNSLNRQLKSLTDNIKGKSGRFRQNLLGKRVDYSGRSVIVVGPNLKLHECGIPKMMALELFKPFIFSKLSMYGRSNSIKLAKKMVDLSTPEVMSVLEEVTKEHIVLLNRAPTLHRLGIQAFEPKLLETKAIQLHPLVCKAFNADFDGDQMAVHVPISIEAQLEARVLMLSSNNVLSPADGSPVISPSKDIALGIYYATSIFDGGIGEGSMFSSFDELSIALYFGSVTYNTKILFRMVQDDGTSKTYETCPGRVLVYDLLSEEGSKIGFEEFNVAITSKILSSLVSKICTVCTQKIAVIFCDRIMEFGFKISTISGISFSKNDIKIPKTKWDHVNKSKSVALEAQNQFLSGYITQKERYNKITDEWSRCTDLITKDMMLEMSVNRDNSKINSVFAMIDSGARGSEAQLKQMAGMRGLMVKASGEVIENPVISNFKEGLSVLEYFNSAHGSRKGAADTALRTADAGYLTRRLVDVAQDCIITEYDCGTSEGVTFRHISSDGKIVEKLSDIINGRIICEDIKDENGSILLKCGTVVSSLNAEIIDAVGMAKVRSVVKCNSYNGICSVCYGIDRSKNEIVSVGEAVGVVAAQSIGEPGTQLTLKTFHVGGISSGVGGRSFVVAEKDGKISFIDLKTVKTKNGDILSVGISSKVLIKSKMSTFEYNIPYGSKILFIDGSEVKQGDKIAIWDWYTMPIISEFSGVAKFVDMIDDISFKERIDESTGMSNKIILDWTRKYKHILPRIAIINKNGESVKNFIGTDAEYLLPFGAVVSINNDEKIEIGDILGRVYRNSSTVGDITGGLPIVESIFEARVPKNPAVIAKFDGHISIEKDSKLKTKIKLLPTDENLKPFEYSIKKGKNLMVFDGTFVRKGDVIVNGDIDVHDVLRMHGIEAALHHVLNGVQSVYKLQGVKIDNKHIELIVKCMLSKVIIKDRGDCLDLSNEDIVSLKYVKAKNSVLESESKKVIEYDNVITGITRASISTDSFISAAAFQETVRVLTDAAVNGKKDFLEGSKENIIVGRLIPAGTGLVLKNMVFASDSFSIKDK